MDLPAVLVVLRCLVRDTFRQALASYAFWLMLAVSGLCTLLCLSVRIDGGESLRRPDTVELVKDGRPLTGPGGDLGSIRLGFGAVQLGLPRGASGEPRAAGVHFLQALLAFWVAGTVGLLAALVWTAGFVPTFLEPAAATVLLAKPAPRWLLVAGKYLAVLVFVGFQEAVFFGGTWLALGLRTGVWPFSYLLCVPLILLQFAVVYSFSVLLGIMTRSTVAAILGSVLFWSLCYGMNYGRHAAAAARLETGAEVTGVAFGQDGEHLASADASGKVTVWDTTTGRVALSLPGHGYPVASLAFSRGGERIGLVAADGTVRVYDTVNGREVLPPRGTGRAASGGLFHPDGRFLLWLSRHSATDKGVEEALLWEAGTGQEFCCLRGHAGKITGVALRADGYRLATAGADGTVRLWDPAGGRPVRCLYGHKGPAVAVAFAPDGRALASAGTDRTARLWDLETGRTRFVLFDHKDAVLGVAFSPDGRRLASAGADGTVNVWDVATGKKCYAVADGGNRVAFGPDGRYLATAGEGRVKLWDASSGDLVRTLPGSFPETGLELLVEAGYWILPKPADLLILLDQAVNAGEHFDALPRQFRDVQRQNGFLPELSLAASLLFTIAVLGAAARRLTVAEY